MGSKPVDSPIEQNHKLAIASGESLSDSTQYQRLIGRLIYLTITRPEVSYVVHILSQIMQNPKGEHLDAVRGVLCYLKGNPGQGILLQHNSDLQVYAFCDSYWGACPLTWHSLTRFLVTLGGSPELGRQRTKEQFLNLQQKQSIEPWPQQRVR